MNRLWQHHFGRGLVDSPNDFGRMGQIPSHPELLDWLALKFREEGGSIKSMHRLLMTSATYQLSSVVENSRASTVDADNRLLWRQHRRKLDAESIRDNLLVACDRLSFRMGGPSFKDFVIERPEHSPHYEYHLHSPSDTESHRRSIYRMIVRSQPQPFLTTLDCADPSISVDRRNESLSPTQALAMLNNKLALWSANTMAENIVTTTSDASRQIQAIYRKALSRNPTKDELELLVAHLKEKGLTEVCRVVLNLNEFYFVD